MQSAFRSLRDFTAEMIANLSQKEGQPRKHVSGIFQTPCHGTSGTPADQLRKSDESSCVLDSTRESIEELPHDDLPPGIK
jgi:hypothetical protein